MTSKGPTHESGTPGFRAPRWLPGGNAQTIWPALFARRFVGARPTWQRVRWTTPDQDFIDLDFSSWPAFEAPEGPTFVLFHGLEGSSASHYAMAFAHECRSRGISMVVPHFRGCSGEPNLAPRSYHSGDWEEIDWILRRLRAESGPLLAAGVSLGGNALMRWAGQMGHEARFVVNAVASISSPLDLAAAGRAIGHGFNRIIYTRMFLRTMKPRALHKLAQHPGLFDAQALAAARDLYEFDNVFTAPLHGFADTEEYWARCSAKPWLARVSVPALCLNAKNDPFVPCSSLPRADEVSSHVRLWQPAHGGHVGFPNGRFPSDVTHMPARVLDWLLTSGYRSEGQE